MTAYPSIAELQAMVAEHYGLRPIEMHSRRRSIRLARPRQVAMYLARHLTLHSLPEIGRHFGGRDHTTIIHGIRVIEEQVERDAMLASDVACLMARAEAEWQAA